MSPSSDRPERFAGHTYPQFVPEPDELVPGPPAPWAHLPVSRRRGLGLAAVEAGLGRARRLVGDPVPEAPVGLDYVADAALAPMTQRAAVLVALYEEAGEAHVILTRRAETLRHHRHEIALPGGRSEPGESAWETALREAHEEVGLDPRLARQVGWLRPLTTMASRASVWPVVGFLAAQPELRANPDEVERVFAVALSDLVADGNFVEERWRRARPAAPATGLRASASGDDFHPIYFFRVPDDLIWGVTARVLTELLSCVLGVNPPGDPGGLADNAK